ncbi:2-alkenal reductase [Anaeromicrobium sediminis]|uniref:2-alkenal reductase n=2 Tax=Anaeromicrobium sediminis TaxID=1478221 RepID=A0A267MME9_9FIRM|nr:2-alkenal reductase [Anaeromicrobium sediminis]
MESTQEVDNNDGIYRKNNKKRNNKNFKLITIIIISALIGGLISSYIMPVFIFGKIIPYPDNYFGNDTKEIIQVDNANTEFLVSAIAKKAMPSVVGITTEIVQRDYWLGERKAQGVGTGVVVHSRGYILTNAHVINNGNAEKVNVLFYDGTKTEGQILWQDPVLDLAVLKVDNVNLVAAELGDSTDLEVGEVAVAIGNPLGLQFERTVTSGIISGLERRIDISEYDSIEGLIQTDASINEGNSGGPLLNSKGQVIGINTAKIKTAEGLGFAVPINVAKPIIEQFIKNGQYEKVYMGIRGMEVDRFERAIGVDIEAEKGVYIVEVILDSPAAKGGLTSGDVIQSIENENISSMSEVSRILYKYRPGDTINMKILRDGKEKEVSIKLQKSPKGYYNEK